MQNQASRAIFDYWINIKGDQVAPQRSQIEPAALRHLLPDLFILSKGDVGAPVFRLAGTRVCDLFDRELRDLDFSSIFLGTGAAAGVEVVHKVLEYEKPALLDIVITETGATCSAEILLLPLWSTDFDGCDRVLGSLLPIQKGQSVLRPEISGLTVRDWTFLTGSPAHFGVPLTTDKANPPSALRRFLPQWVQNASRNL
jgi:hypothetical protein